MSTVESILPATAAAVAAPRAVRRIAGALTLPLLFLVMLSGTLLVPFDSSADAAHQQAWIAAHAEGFGVLTVLELVSTVLLIGALLAVAGRTRDRGRIVGGFGVVVGTFGTIGMAAIAAHHLVQLALVGEPASVEVSVLSRVDAQVGPGLLLLLNAAPVALLLLAIALLRARLMPVPAFVLAAGFFVADYVPLPLGEVVPLLLGFAAFTWTAVVLLLRRA